MDAAPAHAGRKPRPDRHAASARRLARATARPRRMPPAHANSITRRRARARCTASCHESECRSAPSSAPPSLPLSMRLDTAQHGQRMIGTLLLSPACATQPMATHECCFARVATAISARRCSSASASSDCAAPHSPASALRLIEAAVRGRPSRCRSSPTYTRMVDGLPSTRRCRACRSIAGGRYWGSGLLLSPPEPCCSRRFPRRSRQGTAARHRN